MKNLKLVVNNVSNNSDREIFFVKKELQTILNLYGKMVSNGTWKDYGVSIGPREISFDIYQRSSEKLFTREPILKKMLGKSISLSDEGWKILTIRWMFFFFLLALLNEYVWRTQSEEFWVNFKVWGILPITFIFTAFQMFLINKHKI